ncbi:MAG: Hsp20/alpha crystallin family protein [Candidatus Dormibacteraeota bacterium]|nr:Hsp20/alpha crystallin family protein [Candidatus Dormibacteraeota bacterium]
MIRWRFNDNNPVREMLEQVLQAAAQQPAHGRGEPMPINVHQSESDLFIEAALPGVEPEDIDISYSDGVLTLRANSTVAERDYFHQEIRGIEYLRQVMLPVECRFDKAEASVENGMLRVRIPKQRPQPPEKIHIKVNRSAGPTTIEAAKGIGYRELKPETAVTPTPRTKPNTPRKAPMKTASGGAAGARKAEPGPRSGRAR